MNAYISGSWNPVHDGHRTMWLRASQMFDSVCLVPGVPYKGEVRSPEEILQHVRRELDALRAGGASLHNVEVCDAELKIGRALEAYRWLIAKRGGEWAYVAGSDSWNNREFRPEKGWNSVTWLVVRRPGYEVDMTHGAPWCVVDWQTPAVSSTEIRNRQNEIRIGRAKS